MNTVQLTAGSCLIVKSFQKLSIWVVDSSAGGVAAGVDKFGTTDSVISSSGSVLITGGGAIPTFWLLVELVASVASSIWRVTVIDKSKG